MAKLNTATDSLSTADLTMPTATATATATATSTSTSTMHACLLSNEAAQAVRIGNFQGGAAACMKLRRPQTASSRCGARA